MHKNDRVRNFFKEIQDVIIAEGEKSAEKIAALPDGPFKKIAQKQLRQIRKAGKLL
jgi:CRISPR/Cas system CSM-associated protein Csm2 small subunit